MVCDLLAKGMPQMQLPIFPAGVMEINSRVAVEAKDGQVLCGDYEVARAKARNEPKLTFAVEGILGFFEADPADNFSGCNGGFANDVVVKTDPIF